MYVRQETFGTREVIADPFLDDLQGYQNIVDGVKVVFLGIDSILEAYEDYLRGTSQ